MKLADLITPPESTLSGKAPENTQDILMRENTAQNEYPATRENYLRITREITDSSSEKYNRTYEFNTDIKKAILEIWPTETHRSRPGG